MNYRYKFSLTAFVLMLFLSSCSDYLDINDNPNVATEPPIDGLLASSTYNTAQNTYAIGASVSFYTQYLASPNEGGTLDTYEEPDFSGIYSAAYQAMADIYDMRLLAVEQGASHHEAVGNLLMAYHLMFLTDLFGSAPYSQALDGSDITPVWDSGESLYAEANALVDQAITLFGDAEPGRLLSANSDLIHDGDVAAWIRTCYALKARLANHLSKTSDYDPTAVLAAVDQAYTSNDQDMQMSSFPLRNPWAQVAVNNSNLLLGGWLSDQIISHMNGNTYGVFDPRLPLITDTTVFGDYRGTENGAGRAGDGTQAEECYLVTSGYYSSEDAPVLLLTYAEMKFIEAEAAMSGGDMGRAYTAYLEGIRANMEKVGVDMASIDAYLADPAVGVGQGNLTMDLIFKEKYTAMFLNPETWNDARRHDYGYQGFDLPIGANLSEFVRLVTVPEVATARNGENTPNTTLTDRVFWDQ